ncbi:tRNA (adenosine(37)-N6)-threonylcarbamoyltransferase complex dimerization subunit type 1 TsaB [Pseudahrensia aquimaris]|uniref:tRNA (Adenosine(37)-N6)-threonylcarbamoyltransferase complex dimerization subunit type 1 TsaB n=1 Tax=Pseudahrensia aquimaris TaxID=744461 RepID=A0ABW3FLC8_9HYPH
MTLLAIDTSGPFCSAALVSLSGERLADISEEIGRGHAERLMPMLEEVLREVGKVWADVERIAVVRGPGSFTGLRVGLAAARGLALACNIPAQGVTAFEALAFYDGGVGTIALDARRGEVWFQKFAEGLPVSEPMALSVSDCLAQLESGERVIGSGAPILIDSGAKIDVVSHIPSPPILAVANAALVAQEIIEANPLYLRAPDAKPQTPLAQNGAK